MKTLLLSAAAIALMTGVATAQEATTEAPADATTMEAPATDTATTEAPAADAAAEDPAMATTEEPAMTTEDPAVVTTEDPAMADPVDGTAVAREPIMRDGFTLAVTEDITSDMLTGAKVYDANDEWIGDVSELVLTAEGQVTDAVIDVGGFLGMGEKPVALALSDIDILRAEDGDELRVYVQMTKEQLEALPNYES